MKIILGSSSKYRKEILTEMGYTFEVISPDIDEKAIRIKDPQELTLAIAKAKADAILNKIKEPALIITSDQVVTWNNQIREKPQDESEARYFLKSASDFPSVTVTAVVVTNTFTNKQYIGIDDAKICFATFPDDTIEKVLKEGEVYYCAGGFAYENELIQPFVLKIEGEDDSIRGLPKRLTANLIKKALNE